MKWHRRDSSLGVWTWVNLELEALGLYHSPCTQKRVKNDARPRLTQWAAALPRATSTDLNNHNPTTNKSVVDKIASRWLPPVAHVIAP